MESEVRFALMQPDFICTDAEIEDRICHYRRVSYGSHSNKYMKVVVQRESEVETGVVITAFVTSRFRAAEEVIYGERIS